MKVAIASDHAGFRLSEALKEYLKSKKYDVVDFGTSSEDPVDYPDYGRKAAGAVSRKEAERGVLVCGSGIGMCMTANRFKGVRAVVVNDEFDAKVSRQHNDANIICFGARKIDAERAVQLLSVWLGTAFEGGRHEGRVKKIDL